MQKQTITIINNLGLHARAAAKLVATAGRFGSKVEIVKDDQVVNGKSIMGVMMLAASKGTEIEIITEGDDEEAAIKAIVDLINNYFGEGQ